MVTEGLKNNPSVTILIPDSNDRVRAVIGGQGVALWEALVHNELDSGEPCYLTDISPGTVGLLPRLYGASQRSQCRRRNLCGLDRSAAVISSLPTKYRERPGIIQQGRRVMACCLFPAVPSLLQ
jgi:hypothetical protein